MIRSACNAINRISDFLGYMGAFLIFVLALLLGYDVVMRFVFNDPTSWVLDITQLLQATMAFLMASYVMKTGGHVSMNLLTGFLNAKWRRYMAIASHALSVFGCTWMGFLSIRLFTRSYGIREESYGVSVPLYPFKLLVSLCFFMLALQCLAMLIEAIQTSEEEFERLKGLGEAL